MIGSDDKVNGAAIEAEFAWFAAMLDHRIRTHFGQGEASGPLEPPALTAGSAYHRAVETASLDPDERLIAFLALLPFVRPQALDPFLLRNEKIDRVFTEFGGTVAGAGGFRPTRETALFLIAGENLAARLAAQRLFRGDARLTARNVLAAQPDDLAPDLPLVPEPGWVASALGL
jgi:hypothetical protein